MATSPCRANRRRPNRPVLTFLLLTCVAATPTAIVHADALEEVLAAWHARQDKVRSLNCEWTQDELIPKGSADPPRDGGSPRPGVFPPKDTELVARFSFRLRNADARYEEDGEKWSEPAKERIQQHYITALFAGEHRDLFPEVTNGHPLGTIYKDPAYFTLHRDFRALKLVFRPLGAEFNGYDDARLTIASATTPFNGRDCLVLSYVAFKGHDLKDEIWVDGSRQFVPVRYLVKRQGKIVTDLAITYEESAGDWLPSIWIWKSMNLAGRLTEKVTANVSLCLINPSLSDKELALEFPPGVWVHDQKSKESYILRKDGTKRMIKPGEGSKDYDSIMKEISSVGSGN